MDETVKINDLTLCHKHSPWGVTRSTLPDVCRSPTAPVPYTNVAYARDLEDGTTTVRSHGGAMNGVKGSRFFPSYGDEPGTGGGMLSGVNQHEATWLSWSPDVFMEGRAVTRLTDKMHMNRRNTVSIGGYLTKLPNSPKSKPLLEKLCNYICECIAEGDAKQTCVDKKIRADPSNKAKGIFAGAGYYPPNWEQAKGPDGWPNAGSGAGVQRPDVSDLGWTTIYVGQPAFGMPHTLVEIKFAGDRFRGESGGQIGPQRANYEAIAKRYNADFETLDMNKKKGKKPDCDCDSKDDKEKSPAPQTQKSPSSQEVPNQHPPLYCPLPPGVIPPSTEPAPAGAVVRPPILVE